MGGYGSGRWRWHNKKTTVEECLTLDVRKLARNGMLANTAGSGLLVWANVRTGDQAATARYQRDVVGDALVFRLIYTVAQANGEKRDVTEPIVLQTTASRIGGRRWWFTCPLLVSGRPCRRRAGKLFLPPGGRRFGCRRCYDLTYASCQESHRYDRLFRTLATETGLHEDVVKRVLSR